MTTTQESWIWPETRSNPPGGGSLPLRYSFGAIRPPASTTKIWAYGLPIKLKGREGISSVSHLSLSRIKRKENHGLGT